MSEAEIRAAIRDELARLAPEIDFEALDPAVDIREQADLDSMDFLNLASGLHQRLAVEIPEADMAKLVTLDGAIAYLVRKSGASPSP